MADHAVLTDLRAQMVKAGVDLFLIPRGDAFSGEDVPAADQRLAYISGFTGSAGMGIVSGSDAMLYSDGRYTLQMDHQKYDGWGCATMPEAMPEKWLLEHHRDSKLGYDPMLMPVSSYRRLEKSSPLVVLN